MGRKPENRFMKDRRGFLQTLSGATGVLLALPGAGSAAPTAKGYPDRVALQAAHEKKGGILPDKTYRMMELSLHIPPEGKFDIDLEGVVKSARDTGAESLLF